MNFQQSAFCLLLATLVVSFSGISPSLAWGLKTDKDMILCNSREAAENLKVAHVKADLAANWPKTLSVRGCHFLQAGERIQPHGANAHDPDDHDILAVELPNSCKTGWTTDWIYQTRTESNEDESIPLSKCNYLK